MTERLNVRRLLGAAGAAALVCGTTVFATAADRWQPVESEATVTLPDPAPSRGIASAQLACAEQHWSLALKLSPETKLAVGPLSARLAVGAQHFEAEAKAEAGTVTFPVPSLAIGPLKVATRALVTIDDKAEGLETAFSLRGSRVAIEAAAPFCSKRDMSDYETVALTPYSSYLIEARELRKDEIDLFRQATTAEPVVSATKAVMADGRSLLFVELCGSSWYYGASGCNVAAFARLGNAVDWKKVYDAEGADLYLDRQAMADGWPTVISLPKKGGGDLVRWTWDGDGYALSDDAAVATAGDSDSGQ